MSTIKNMKKYIIITTAIVFTVISGLGITVSALDKNKTTIIDEIENKETTEETKLNSKTESDNGSYSLISVKQSDENKFSPEEWKKVLKQIAKGEVYWEEENSTTVVENKIATYDPSDQKDLN